MLSDELQAMGEECHMPSDELRVMESQTELF